jgi:hypothetical protein
MKGFDRFSIKFVAGVGLCGAAIALSPHAAATPLKTGGGACMYGAAGEVGAAAGGVGAGAGGVGAAGAAAPCAGAPVADMAGAAAAPLPVGAPVLGGAPIPGGLPFPAGAPVPAGAGAPLPVAVPAGAPLIALGGLPGAPIADMAGVAGGKDAPTGPAPTSGPMAGQPLPPGPPE